MSSIKLVGSTSGEITISAPAVAGTNTLTLPANTGTIVTSASGVGDLPSTIAGPAFSAWQSVQQTGITVNTWTKVTLTTETFDTNSNYDTSTSKFTPTVAGYYYITGSVTIVGANSAYYVIGAIYKNGTQYSQFSPVSGGGSYYPTSGPFGNIVYFNGTTDYVELYVFGSAGGAFDTFNNAVNTNFSGHLVRAA